MTTTTPPRLGWHLLTDNKLMSVHKKGAFFIQSHSATDWVLTVLTQTAQENRLCSSLKEARQEAERIVRTARP